MGRIEEPTWRLTVDDAYDRGGTRKCRDDCGTRDRRIILAGRVQLGNSRMGTETFAASCSNRSSRQRSPHWCSIHPADCCCHSPRHAVGCWCFLLRCALSGCGIPTMSTARDVHRGASDGGSRDGAPGLTQQSGDDDGSWSKEHLRRKKGSVQTITF